MEVVKPKRFYIYLDDVFIEYGNVVKNIGNNAKLRRHILRNWDTIKKAGVVIISTSNTKNFLVVLRKRHYHDSPIDYEWREEIVGIEPLGEKVTEWIHSSKGNMHETNTVYGELWEVPKETREITIRYKEISDNMGHIREEEKTITF